MYVQKKDRKEKKSFYRIEAEINVKNIISKVSMWLNED